MSVFALRLPDDLKDMATSQAADAGASLNQFIAVAVAARVGARAVPGRAKAILERAGVGHPPRADDLPLP